MNESSEKRATASAPTPVNSLGFSKKNLYSYSFSFFLAFCLSFCLLFFWWKRIDHLFEELNVVGIVVVSEVEDTRFSVLSDPLQSCVAIGNATRLRLELFILFRHLSCCSPPNQSFLLTVTNPLQQLVVVVSWNWIEQQQTTIKQFQVDLWFV